MYVMEARQNIRGLQAPVKDAIIFRLLQEQYNTCTIIGTDGKEHYARLEMSFDDYVEKYIGEF